MNTLFKVSNKVTAFLWYDNQAGEAAALYIRLLGNGHIVHMQCWCEGAHDLAGSVMAGSFELHGQK